MQLASSTFPLPPASNRSTHGSRGRRYIPLILTLAGVLDAVPLEDGHPALGAHVPLVFDALAYPFAVLGICSRALQPDRQAKRVAAFTNSGLAGMP